MCSIKSYKAIRFSIRNIVMYIWCRVSAFLSIEDKKEKICFPHKPRKEKRAIFSHSLFHTCTAHIFLCLNHIGSCLVVAQCMKEEGHLQRLKAISENCWPNWPLEVKQFVNTFLAPKHVSTHMQLLNFQPRCFSGLNKAVSEKPETRPGPFTEWPID